MSDAERRQHLRVPANVVAVVVHGKLEPAAGTIANFSEKGIFLRTDRSPSARSKVHLEFIVKPQHTVCEASGRVAWIGPLGIGVTFDAENDHYRAFLNELEKAAQSPSDARRIEILSRIFTEPNIEIS